MSFFRTFIPKRNLAIHGLHFLHRFEFFPLLGVRMDLISSPALMSVRCISDFMASICFSFFSIAFRSTGSWSRSSFISMRKPFIATIPAISSSVLFLIIYFITLSMISFIPFLRFSSKLSSLRCPPRCPKAHKTTQPNSAIKELL